MKNLKLNILQRIILLLTGVGFLHYAYFVAVHTMVIYDGSLRAIGGSKSYPFISIILMVLIAILALLTAFSSFPPHKPKKEKTP